MPTTDNPHEEAARWRKVALLLAALYEYGIPPPRVAKLGHRQWATVALAARINAPSALTIELLRETLRGVFPPNPPTEEPAP